MLGEERAAREQAVIASVVIRENLPRQVREFPSLKAHRFEGLKPDLLGKYTQLFSSTPVDARRKRKRHTSLCSKEITPRRPVARKHYLFEISIDSSMLSSS